MFPECSPKCRRCVSLNANYRHICWDCQGIRPFWGLIGQEVDKIPGQHIPLTLRGYLLHDLSKLKISKHKKMLLLNLCVAASLLIASNWKSTVAPHKHQRLAKIRFISLIGKLTAIVKCKQRQVKAIDLFQNRWGSFLSTLFSGEMGLYEIIL